MQCAVCLVEPAQPAEMLGAAQGSACSACPLPPQLQGPAGSGRSCQLLMQGNLIGVWPLYFCSAVQDQHFSHFQQDVTSFENFALNQAFS